VGSDSINHIAYAYNGDGYDDQFLGQPGYGQNIPVVGAKFLSDSMSTFIYYNIGAGVNGDPQTAAHWVNYLNAQWQDGSPVLYGGDGLRGQGTTTFPTTHFYTGDPHHQTGWTEITPGDSALPHSPADRRFLASMPYFSLNAGESKTVSLAYGYGRKDSVAVHTENIAEMVRVLNHAKAVWDTITTPTATYGSNYNCPLFVGLEEVAEGARELPEMNIYPVPTSGLLHISTALNVQQIQLLDFQGRIVEDINHPQPRFVIDMSSLRSGVYIVRGITGEGEWINKK
jgi:hypothetical protein